jgi:hypothetical protein
MGPVAYAALTILLWVIIAPVYDFMATSTRRLS